VGSEDREQNPIRYYIKELLDFRRKCDNLKVDLPFIFHAGETLKTGTPVDQNLFDAILLNSKRIGHGYALPKHPLAMQLVKDKGIALEICPISNEVLHLCSSIRGHILPILLANNVPCSVNSDNGTFYRFVTSLPHCFPS
jgi:adenosine deaminase CECR1